jgi:hypothetical protein
MVQKSAVQIGEDDYFSHLFITSQKIFLSRFARRGMASLPRQAE